MGGLSPWHWLVILAVALIVFGGYKKLPDAARSVGRSMRIFKSEVSSLRDDDNQTHDTGTTRPAPASPPVIEGEPIIRPTAAHDEPSRRRKE